MTADTTRAAPCPAVDTGGSVLNIGTRGFWAVRHRTELHGVALRHSGVSCRASASGPCTLTFAVPRRDAWFHISYRGPSPSAFVTTMMRSVTPLPPGLTTVPGIAYGESVEDALDRLGDAGLVGRAPQVDFPHYVTGTVPGAGRVVRSGDTVRLTIGDG